MFYVLDIWMEKGRKSHSFLGHGSVDLDYYEAANLFDHSLSRHILIKWPPH